jgi:tRNA A-37 threonylcarbamoyl transferase component Bud32
LTSAPQTLPNSTPKLTRRVLDGLPLRTLHAARNWSKADVYLSEWPAGSGCQIVIKDFKKRALWFRIVAGRFFLRREWNALRALNGTPGVPRPIAKPDADSLVVEYLPGTALSDVARRTVSDATMDRLEELIHTLHRRGVTHGDLHLENILVDDSGNVTLLDWATAHVFDKRNKAQQWLFEEWQALDLRAVAKAKVYHARHLVTEKDQEFLEGGSRTYRFIKSLRRTSDKLRGKKPSGRLERAVSKVKSQSKPQQPRTQNEGEQ